ncbi:hypothetical protein B0H19DRAFT_1253088 [Mycena capillaripes]|nr:hypothetical protein B0H19DRAFT_1253088 [Mycena capillaripes]
MSRPRSTRSTASSSSSGSSFFGRGSGLRGISEYEAAAAYGEPAPSDPSQIARAIEDSKRTAQTPRAVSRAFSYASSSSSSSSSSTLLGSDSDSSSTYSYYAPSPAHSYYAPTTPRHAAKDEVIARNLAQSWDVASMQSQLIADPQYSRAGPPAVLRSPSPSPTTSTRSSRSSGSSRSSASSQRTAYDTSAFQNYTGYSPVPTPTPSRPLSPLLLPTRLRTPSVRSSASSIRSVSSVSSIRSARSASSAASTASRASLSSLLSSVARAERHAPLHTAATALRASLARSASTASLARSTSTSSIRSGSTINIAVVPPSSASHAPSRASSVRSQSQSTAGTARGDEIAGTAQTDERAVLAQLRALANSPLRCTNPGCGTLIVAARWDDIPFPPPPPSSSSSPNPANPNPANPPLPPALLAALHAHCPLCATPHCRGCGAAVQCGVGCSGAASTPASALAATYMYNTGSPYSPSPSQGNYNARCPIPTHCPPARALGTLAALLAFERAYSSINVSTVNANTSPNGKGQSREADRALLGALGTLVYFLSPSPTPASLPATPPASGSNQAPGGWAEREEENEDAEAHPALPALISMSGVLGYAGALLRSGARSTISNVYAGSNSPSVINARGGDVSVDVGTWMARAPAFGAVLALLRALALGGAGCAGVLERPLLSPSSSTLQRGNLEGWLRTGMVSRPPRSPHSSTSSRAHQTDEEETLRTLIRTLDPARAALLRLAGASTFGPTVARAHALCDAVLWLGLWECCGL